MKRRRIPGTAIAVTPTVLFRWAVQQLFQAEHEFRGRLRRFRISLGHRNSAAVMLDHQWREVESERLVVHRQPGHPANQWVHDRALGRRLRSRPG